MAQAVTMGVLGPLVVEIGDRRVTDLPRKERALLELLAIEAGHPVPVHQIVPALWERELTNERKSLQVLVYRLRRHLEDQGLDDGATLVGTEGEAYVLHLAREAIDRSRFERLVAEGHSQVDDDPLGAVGLLDEALALWRGEPVPDLGAGDTARAERTRLVELRRSAEEDRWDALLALGGADALVGELEGALAVDPLRERRWRQLMLALYRSGRQADALRAYQRARATLVDELGIEPGPELRRLEAAVIAHDPALDGPGATAARAGPAADSMAEASAGGPFGIAGGWASAVSDVPLIGRVHEMDRLTEHWSAAVSGRGTIVFLTGPAGSGKTRLAAELAARALADGEAVVLGRELAELHETGQSGQRDPRTAAGFIVRHLDEYARGGPVLVVFDPLPTASHWSTEVVRELARLVVGQAVMLLVLARDDDAGAVDAVEEMADLLGPALDDHLALPSLTGPESYELVRQRLGTPGGTADDPALALLVETARGNPFALVEMARHALDQGWVGPEGTWTGPTDLEGLGVPDRLRVRIGRRLGLLGPDQLSILSSAAASGPEFDDVTAAVAADAPEELVVDTLDAAVDAGLLAEDDGRPGWYRFVSPLHRRVLVDRLSESRRSRIEARLAGGASPDPGEAGTGSVPSTAVSPTGDARGVWEAYVEIAERASRGGDVLLLARSLVGAGGAMVRLGVERPVVTEWLRQVDRDLSADDPVRVEVQSILLREFIWEGRWEEAFELIREDRDAAELVRSAVEELERAGAPTGSTLRGDAGDRVHTVVDLLQELVRNECVNDGSRPVSETPNADAIEAVLEGPGLELARFEPVAGRPSVLARLPGRDPSAPKLLLLALLDVAPADDAEEWRHDPFGGELIDGEVWGRGTMASLGHAATMAIALRSMADVGFRPAGDVTFLAAADGNHQGEAGLCWLAEHEPDVFATDYALVEGGGVPIPTPNGVCLLINTGWKASSWYRLTIVGDQVVTSVPDSSTTAVMRAASAVQRIVDWRAPVTPNPEWEALAEVLGFGAAIEPLLDPARFDEALAVLPPFMARTFNMINRTTFTTPGIHGGAAGRSTYPRSVSVDLNIRTMPDETEAEALRQLTKALGDLGPYTAVEPVLHSPGRSFSTETPLWDCLERVSQRWYPGSRLAPFLSPGMTDAVYLPPGPVVYGFSMASNWIPYEECAEIYRGQNERVDIESLRMTTSLWEAVARDLA